MRSAAILLALASSSCTIEVVVDHKGCPCTDGYVCDIGLNQCVPDTCDPKITVTDFHAVWSTSNTIRWGWTAEGIEEDFLEYELWVAPSKEALHSDDRLVFTSDDNPELGFFDAGFETWSYGLEPDQSYVAHLRATDNAVCTYGTPLVGESTLIDLPNVITLFRDDLPDGSVLTPGPPMFDVAPDENGAHLFYDVAQDIECNPDVDDARQQCGQPLRLSRLDRGLSRDPSSPSTGGLHNLNEAFLEMKIGREADFPSLWSEVWLRFGDCFGEEHLYQFDTWMLRPGGEYFTVQVPLRVLRGPNENLTFGVLDTNAGGQTLCEVAAGLQWFKDGTVRLDDILIRY